MAWKIGGIFGRSAFGPIYEHMTKVQSCVDQLPALIGAFCDGDVDKANEIAGEVHRFEREADLIKVDIRHRLTTSVFSATERSDIMTLLRAQDNVADRTESAAGMMQMRKTQVSEGLRPHLLDLVQQILQGTSIVSQAEKKLDDAGDVVLNGEVSRDAREELKQFYELAHEIATSSRVALGRLFELEKTLDPISVIFLMEVIRYLGRVCDALENTSDVLMRMIARK